MMIDPKNYLARKAALELDGVTASQAACAHPYLLMHNNERPYDEWYFHCPACDVHLRVWQMLPLLLAERNARQK